MTHGAARAMLVLGALIIAMWTVFLITGVMKNGLATVENNQLLAFHILAEVMMGAALLVAGVALLHTRPWGAPVGFLALGMTIYSTVNSLGHSVRNEPALTPVLLGSLTLSLVLSFILFRSTLHHRKDGDHGSEHAERRLSAGAGHATAGEPG